MKRMIMACAVAMMTAITAFAQRIHVVDSEGQGIPLVSVLTEDGVFIGTTGLDGVLADVKGETRVAVSHVAYKPQIVTVASLQDGRITMEDIGYDLDEIVVKPKPYIYVEAYYRVYVYRNDSLCYFLGGIMPNAYNVQKKKLEHGSYYQAYSEHCKKFGAAVTWGARAQRFQAGLVGTKAVPEMEKAMKEKYFVTATADNPRHTTYRNERGTVGQLVNTGGLLRMTIDGGKSQMYANEKKGETKMLERRKKVGYEYQYTQIFKDNQEEGHAVTQFLMDINHWEYNDKKGHVKFIIETYATDHCYMDAQEWKNKKKSMKTDYSPRMTLNQLADYERKHNIPMLSTVTRQAIGKLKQQ